MKTSINNLFHFVAIRFRASVNNLLPGQAHFTLYLRACVQEAYQFSVLRFSGSPPWMSVHSGDWGPDLFQGKLAFSEPRAHYQPAKSSQAAAGL